jgi:replicative DNA helicase
VSETKYDLEFGVPFQLHILAVAARSPAFVLRFRNVLAANYFNDPGHADVMQVLLSYADKYKGVPTRVTFEEALKDALPAASLARATTVLAKMYKEDISDADAVTDRVVEFGKTQALCLAVMESADLIEKQQTKKIRSVMDQASLVGEDLLNAGIDYRKTMDARLLASDDDDARDTVPTGIYHLDMLLNGGLGRGELGMFIGAPKRGKSMVLVNVAFGALVASAGYNVVYYTLEINERKIARRFDTRLAGPHGALRKSDPDKYRAELQSRVKKLVKGNLVIKGYPTRSASVASLRSHLSLLVAGSFRPDCVVEGSMVLTDKGLFPIELVPCDSRLWDGESWVSHGGPICKGVRDVISYCGITATPDHQVWTAEGWRSLITCARLGLHIAQTGIGGRPIRLGGSYVGGGSGSGEQVAQAAVCFDAMSKVPAGEVGNAGEPSTRSGEGLSRLSATAAVPPVALGSSGGCPAAVYESEEHGMAKLRGAGGQVRVSECGRGVLVGAGALGGLPRATVGSSGQRQGLRAREPALVHAGAEPLPYAEATEDGRCSSIQIGAPRGAVRGFDVVGAAAQTDVDAEADRQAVAEWKVGRATVWDILNSGPFHRFTVQGRLVHNCVIVDYGDILKAERRMGEHRHEQAGIYEDLRAMAGEYDCAVWTASQANRGSIEKATPDVDSVAESFEKIAIADAVFGIGQTTAERLDGQMRLVALALRNAEDRCSVFCSASRPKQMIRSIGLYDAANNLISGEVDATEAEAKVAAASGPAKTDVAELKKKLTGGVAAPATKSAPAKLNVPADPKKPGYGGGGGPRKKDRPTKAVTL